MANIMRVHIESYECNEGNEGDYVGSLISKLVLRIVTFVSLNDVSVGSN